MEFPYITFHTKGGDSIRWREGYAGVTNVELETFLQQSRDTVASLEAEIEKRQLRIPSGYPDGNNRCHEKLRKAADKLKIMERLDDRASKHVDTAVEVLTRSQMNRAFKVYQDFLYDVLRHCSPGLVLLCAIGLGKQRVANMTTEDRVSLLNYLKEKNDSLSFPTLESLAEDHEIPSLDSPRIAHISGRSRKRKRDEELNSYSITSTHPDSTPDTHQVKQSAQVQARGPDLGSLAGDVYELTVEDARAAADSDQIGGKV